MKDLTGGQLQRYLASIEKYYKEHPFTELHIINCDKCRREGK